MAEKELKWLSRKELLELLIKQEKENTELRAALQEVRTALENRTVQIEKCGTLAEAALALNGVYEAADAAARQYLENVRQFAEQTERQREEILADAAKQADAILTNAQKKADAMADKAKQKAAGVTAKSGNGSAEKAKRAPSSVKTEAKADETQ